jgi:hypothetical protein
MGVPVQAGGLAAFFCADCESIPFHRQRSFFWIRRRRMLSLIPAASMCLFASATAGLFPTSPMRYRAPTFIMRADDSGSLDRRTANLVFLATMTSFAAKPLFRETLPDLPPPTWDVAAAKAAAKAGALCPLVSCADARFAEVQAALDTSTLKSNAIGTAEEHVPVVYVETAFGMSERSMAMYKVVVVAPIPKKFDDVVELMWLRDKTNGRVVAVRSFEQGAQKNPVGQTVESWPPTLSASLKEPYVGISRGETLEPLVFYRNAGLWIGEPFVLCGPEQAVCSGGGLVSNVARPIETANKFGAAKVGQNLLSVARPELM